MDQFEWPWQYNFPPFFTIQVNQDTLKTQLAVWRLLVIDYLKANKECILDVREASTSPLFRNNAINRRLPEEGILVVLKDLARTGHAEPVDKTQQRWYVYWETLEQLGSSVYKWANDRGMTNTVCTLFEISNGDAATGEIFYGINETVLEKALKKLELEKKAEVFEFDNNKGVKFF